MFELLLGSQGDIGPTLPTFVKIEAADFITGSALSPLAGISAGTLTTDADTRPWYLIRDRAKGKIVVIASGSLRSNLTYASLGANASAGGVPVQIAGCQWNCRIMHGPVSDAQSEWMRYMHGLSEVANALYPKFATLTYDELGLVSRPGVATFVYPTNGGKSVRRGNAGNINYAVEDATTQAYGSSGWRPILEYVSGELPW